MAQAKQSSFPCGERHVRALRRELDRASKRYPDLRLELFVPRRRSVDEGRPKDMWAAVRAAFSENDDEKWVLKDKTFYYKMSGESRGIEKLLSLEDDIDLAIGSLVGVSGGDRIPPAALACYLGLPSRIPLLQTRQYHSDPANDKPPPKWWHIVWLSPKDSPFHLLRAALDWMLEPNGLLSAPDALQAISKMLPFWREVREFVKRVERDHAEEPKPGKRVTAVRQRITDLPVPHSELARILAYPYAFKECDPLWVFRFTDDEGTEEGILPHLEGFADMRRIMQSPFTPFTNLAAEGSADEDLTFQEQADEDSLIAVTNRMKLLLERRAKHGVLSEKEGEELRDVLKYRRNAISKLKTARGLKAGAQEEAARKRVHKAIELNAKGAIGKHKQLKRFRKYLDATLTYKDEHWCYAPRKHLDWYF